MNQTHNWALRQVALLKKHIDERRQAITTERQALERLRGRHHQEAMLFGQSSQGDNVALLSVLIQQAAEQQALINYFNDLRGALHQRQQQEAQLLQRQLEQEKVRQN